MAERIVSPGVFTNERDLSFLPIGVGEIGAAIIGATLKGPAFVPTVVRSHTEFAQKFGGEDDRFFVPYTVRQYLKSAGAVTIVRVLGTTGYSPRPTYIAVLSGSVGRIMAGLFPSELNPTALFTSSTLGATTTTTSSFDFYLSGSGLTKTDFTGSLVSSDANFIGNIFSQETKSDVVPAYRMVIDRTADSASSFFQSGSIKVLTGSIGADYAQAYQSPATPMIRSQAIAGTRRDLFKLISMSHGTNSNYELKIGITNIKGAGQVAGSAYGEFTVVVRGVDSTRIPMSPYTSADTDLRPDVIESFANVNLDPTSPNYIGRRIGDQYKTVDVNGKVTVNGDYPNRSSYIRVEIEPSVQNGAIPPVLVPYGYAALQQTIPIVSDGAVDYFLSAASTVTTQESNSAYNRKVYHGFNFDFANTDNLNYLGAIPASSGSVGNNVAFNLDTVTQHADAPGGAVSMADPANASISIDSKKFIVPMQGGFDGLNPATPKAGTYKVNGTNISNTNLSGFNLSSASAAGSVAFIKAINTVSNPDEIDINMLVIPGLTSGQHTAVIEHAKQMVEDRADTFFIFDSGLFTSTITDAVGEAAGHDSNYAATYYPWVKIRDTAANKAVWVPPSVVLPGIVAFTDKVAHEWFAPAGLNRGGLTDVLDVATRLTQTERDTLYEGRVNPIATFPNLGIAVWGQKTLQVKPSALDRVNVRRLLITVKKFIASATKFLVFEQNNDATRNRFLNIANPYLESVQQRSGLTAFKVVMDESNTTADDIDRNILRGQLFLQPTRSAEFILLDFNISRTGAAFSDSV